MACLTEHSMSSMSLNIPSSSVSYLKSFSNYRVPTAPTEASSSTINNEARRERGLTSEDQTSGDTRRSVSPTSSSSSDIQIDIEPLSLRFTIVDEALRKVNYYMAKREVRAAERALAQTKFKELNALNELIKAQAALADKRLFEADMEIGRAKVELTDVRQKATSEVRDEISLMHMTSGIASFPLDQTVG